LFKKVILIRMNKLILVSFIFIYSIFLPFYSLGSEPEIIVSGGWLRVIDHSDLKAGAGSDLIESYESPLDSTVIDIIANSRTSWAVYVRRINQADDLSIHIRRTSNGTGEGIIEGGENFILVEESPKLLFRGKGEKRSITVQLKISGVSINIPPGSRGFRIYYEVREEH
jgi:hypothetical protein